MKKAMDFIQWVENLDRQMDAPASAEVIRTGMQPQVDSNQDAERQSHEEIMGLDSHIQRIRTIVHRMSDKSETAKKLKALMNGFMEMYDDIVSGRQHDEKEKGLGNAQADDDKLNWMKENQPLPEPPRKGAAFQPPIS